METPANHNLFLTYNWVHFFLLIIEHDLCTHSSSYIKVWIGPISWQLNYHIPLCILLFLVKGLLGPQHHFSGHGYIKLTSPYTQTKGARRVEHCGTTSCGPSNYCVGSNGPGSTFTDLSKKLLSDFQNPRLGNYVFMPVQEIKTLRSVDTISNCTLTSIKGINN